MTSICCCGGDFPFPEIKTGFATHGWYGLSLYHPPGSRVVVTWRVGTAAKEYYRPVTVGDPIRRYLSGGTTWKVIPPNDEPELVIRTREWEVNPWTGKVTEGPVQDVPSFTFTFLAEESVNVEHEWTSTTETIRFTGPAIYRAPRNNPTSHTGDLTIEAHTWVVESSERFLSQVLAETKALLNAISLDELKYFSETGFFSGSASEAFARSPNSFSRAALATYDAAGEAVVAYPLTNADPNLVVTDSTLLDTPNDALVAGRLAVPFVAGTLVDGHTNNKAEFHPSPVLNDLSDAWSSNPFGTDAFGTGAAPSANVATERGQRVVHAAKSRMKLPQNEALAKRHYSSNWNEWLRQETCGTMPGSWKGTEVQIGSTSGESPGPATLLLGYQHEDLLDPPTIISLSQTPCS